MGRKVKVQTTRSLSCNEEDDPSVPSKILWGTQGNEIYEFDVSADEISPARCIVNSHEERLDAIACHPVLNRIASGSMDCTIAVWDTDTHVLLGNQVKIQLEGETHAGVTGAEVMCIDFSHDGELLAVGLTNGCFCVYSGGNSDPI